MNYIVKKGKDKSQSYKPVQGKKYYDGNASEDSYVSNRF